jgi:putative ABC transport system ATP-binding protein
VNEILPLEMTSVSRVYGEGPAQVIAVDDINLCAGMGQVVMIVGPSGSGKTTLLSLAGCLLKPTAGSIRVMGREVAGLTERELPQIRLRHIGFVFQSFHLLAPLDARENVLIAMNLAGKRGSDASERADALLGELGLAERSQRRVHELSAGEQQRVAIARALANQPDVLLADEPTASLDSQTGRKVMQLLASAVARKETGALIVVTHDTRVLKFADRVLWMEDGHLGEKPRLAVV